MGNWPIRGVEKTARRNILGNGIQKNSFNGPRSPKRITAWGFFILSLLLSSRVADRREQSAGSHHGWWGPGALFPSVRKRFQRRRSNDRRGCIPGLGYALEEYYPHVGPLGYWIKNPGRYNSTVKENGPRRLRRHSFRRRPRLRSNQGTAATASRNFREPIGKRRSRDIHPFAATGNNLTHRQALTP
jgi:hypothetical protein